MLVVALLHVPAALHAVAAPRATLPPTVAVFPATPGSDRAVGDFPIRSVVPHGSAALFPSSSTLLAYRTPSGSVDLSSFLDDEINVRGGAGSRGATDSEKKADARREELRKEEEMQKARAKVAIERMDAAEAAKVRAAEAALASGVPPCESSVWGGAGQTGLLSAKACARARDGMIEEGKRTGAFIIF